LSILLENETFGVKDNQFWSDLGVICFQDAMPGRYKGFHYYNCGAVFEAMMAIYRPFLKKKTKERVMC
jgi:hypothetical protein